ncbi:hypothetical protein ACSSS7_000539 [Eimeria intestinalis]
MGGSYQQQQQLQQLLRFFDLPPSCRCLRSVRMRYLLLAKQRHPDQQPAAAAAAAGADFALLQYNYDQLRSMLADEAAATAAHTQQQQQQQRQQWQQQQRQSWQQHPGSTSNGQWWYQQRHEQRQQWQQHWQQEWQDYQQQQQQQHWHQQQQQQKWHQEQQQNWKQQQGRRASFTPFPAALRGAGMAFGITAAYWLTHTGPSHRSVRSSSNESSSSSSLPEDEWYLHHDKQHQQQQQRERWGDHYEPASLARHRMLAHSRREQMLRHMQMSQQRRERLSRGNRGAQPPRDARRPRGSSTSNSSDSSNSSKKRQQVTPHADVGIGAAAAVLAADPRSRGGDSSCSTYDSSVSSSSSSNRSSSSSSIDVPREPQAWRDEFVRVARLVQGQPDSHVSRAFDKNGSSSSSGDTSDGGLVLQWERTRQPGFVSFPSDHSSSVSADRTAAAAAEQAEAAESHRHLEELEWAPQRPCFMLEVPEPAEATASLAGPAATATAAAAAAAQPHPRSKSAGNLAERDDFYAKRYIHRAVRVMRRGGTGEQQGHPWQQHQQPQHRQENRWPPCPEDALLQPQLAQQQLMLHEPRVEAPLAL